MAPKRPAPLSDAALAPPRGEAGREPAALGETNAGAPLPVKNTFIDVPSGFTPTSTQAKKPPVSTAPAQVGVAAGFVRSSILASVQSAMGIPPTPASPASPMKITSALQPTFSPPSPKKGGAMAVQRPGGVMPGTPLMTPSPTGTSSFSAARYQLFGGPAPVQEATHSALAPAGQSSTLAFAPLQAGTLGGGTSGPLGYGPSSFGQSAPAAETPAPAEQRRPAAAAAKVQRLPRVEQESRSKENDSEDEDSEDADGQEQGAAGARGPEDAPKPPEGALHPSLGSEQHEEGTCKRCCFFPRNRCHNGYDCEFCHYEHEKRKRKSKKSKKKKKEGEAGEEGAEGAEAPEGAAAASSSSAPCAEAGAEAGAAEVRPPAAQPWEQGLGPRGYYGAPGEPWLQMPLLSMPAAPPEAGQAGAEGEAPVLVTYQWTDAVPSQSPLLAAAAAAAAAAQGLPCAAAPSYFATATGFAGAPGPLEPPWPGQPPPYCAAYAPHAPGAPPGPPPYAPYPGAEAAERPWPGPPPGAAPASPPAAPASPPRAAEPPAAAPAAAPAAPAAPPAGEPQQSCVQQLVVSTPAAHSLHGPAPPPAEEPKLPRALQAGGDAVPPPPTPPRLPPTVEVPSPEQEGPKAPPPVSSPKLPKNLAESLEQETPPVPGESPT